VIAVFNLRTEVFPRLFGGKRFRADVVLDQLCYRCVTK